MLKRTPVRYDGSVSMVADGDEDHLMELLQTVHRSHLGKYIPHERVRHSSATEEFPLFGVSY